MYPWLKYGHFVGIGVLVVGMGLHVVAVERLWRVDGVARFRELLVVARLGVRLVLVGGFVLVAFGVTLALQAFSLLDGWILSAMGLIVAQGVMGSVVSERYLEALEVAVEDPRPVGAVEPGSLEPGDHVPVGPVEILAGSGAWPLRAAGRVSIVNLFVLELLMTLKPTGGHLLAVLLSAILLVAGVAGVARRSRLRAWSLS